MFPGLQISWSPNVYQKMSILKIVKCNFYPRQLNFKTHKKNERDSCLRLASRKLQFWWNFNFDVCQDHFSQSLCILHSHSAFCQWLCILHIVCAFKVCKIFLVEVGWRVVPELPKTNSHWSLFFSFCGAWCMLVSFLWHLNLSSGVLPYTGGQIQIPQWFTGVWQVVKAVYTVFIKKTVKMGPLCCKSTESFAGKVVPRKNGTYGGRSRTNSLDSEIPKRYRINYFELPHLNHKRWWIHSFHNNTLWLIFVCLKKVSK